MYYVKFICNYFFIDFDFYGNKKKGVLELKLLP